MAITRGCDGQIKVGTNAMGYIDSYSLSMNTGTTEVSQLGSEWKEYFATTKDWSGSASGTFDYSESSYQKGFVDNFISSGNTNVTLVFKISADKSLTGSAICTGVSVNASHGDKISVSFNFTGTGALSSATGGD